MCIFRSSPSPQPMPTPPPMMSRINPELKDSTLPKKKDMLDEDEISKVEYGGSKKESGAAAGKKVGTAALRIPLNTRQTTQAGQSGGLNV